MIAMMLCAQEKSSCSQKYFISSAISLNQPCNKITSSSSIATPNSSSQHTKLLAHLSLRDYQPISLSTTGIGIACQITHPLPDGIFHQRNPRSAANQQNRTKHVRSMRCLLQCRHDGGREECGQIGRRGQCLGQCRRREIVTNLSLKIRNELCSNPSLNLRIDDIPRHAYLKVLWLSCLQIHGKVGDIDFGPCLVTELMDGSGGCFIQPLQRGGIIEARFGR
mmetsp:Transcript_7510/g.13226  ORF Transcript_7510/g.13226 Transcript_7510/m.13226 type:complete len:222 (-) Transcript_7510:517-1182(-)